MQYLIGSSFFVVAIVLGYSALKLLRHRKLIENMQTSDIAHCMPGLTELKGKIVPLELLESPYSGRPCVYYSCKVEEHPRHAKSSVWRLIHSDSKSVDFLVEDGTGRALVQAEGAEFSIADDSKAQMGVFDDPTAEFDAFLGRIGLNPRNFFGFNRRLRVTESFLEAGDGLYLLGTVRPAYSQAETTGARVVMSRKPKGEFFISDGTEVELLRSLEWDAIVRILLGTLAAGLGAIAMVAPIA